MITWTKSGPGYFAGINITKKGKWSKRCAKVPVLDRRSFLLLVYILKMIYLCNNLFKHKNDQLNVLVDQVEEVIPMADCRISVGLTSFL